VDVRWLIGLAAVAGMASILAFVLMASDKRRARTAWHRIPERTFVLLALVGGWPGILAGGLAFRHKTKARGFQAKVVGAALLHAGLAFVLFKNILPAW
jgi:uncharacterized membrane protein YsdA (DUF1294 family)